MNVMNAMGKPGKPASQAAEFDASLRKSGLEIIGDVSWGTHICQFYATKADLIDTLVPYFRAGLEANEFCMWVTSEPLQVDEARAALGKAVPDLDRFLADGHIEILDHSQWYTLGGGFDAERVLQGWIGKLEAARKRGFEGLRLTGNTFWLEPGDWEAFSSYEAKVESIVGSMRMLVLCTYPLEKYSTREALEAIANHEFALVCKGGRWEPLKNVARRKAAQALEESDARFRALFDNMAEGFALHEIITDETGEPCDYRFLDVNPAFERQTGLKRADLLGKRVLEALPDVEPRWIKSCGHVALTGKPTHFESCFGPRRRRFQVFSYRAAPRRFAAVLSDITERKQAEEERQAHLWFLESMDRVNRALQGTNDIEQMMSDVLDAVLAIFACDRAWLLYPGDPEAVSFSVPMERTRPEWPGALALGLDLPKSSGKDFRKICQTVLAASGPLRFGPGSEHPVPEEAKLFGVQSQTAMAIFPKVDKPYVFGLHQCSYPRAWTPREARLFEEIGRRLADALSSLLMLRSLREAERKQAAEKERQAHLWFLESMDRINRAIQGANDLEQMMSEVLDAVLTIFGSDRAWLIYPCDPEAVSFSAPMERWRPEYRDAPPFGTDLPCCPDFGKMCQTVLAAGAPVQFGGPGSEDPTPAEAAERFRVQSQIAMAIYPKGDRPYLFGLHQCSYSRVWTPEEKRLLEEIGRRLADALTSQLALRSLRESEERLRMALASANAGAWSWDLSADAAIWSPECFELFGLDSAGGVPAYPEWRERCLHPEDRQRVYREIEAILSSGVTEFKSEYRIVHPQAGVRWVLARGHVERTDGKPTQTWGLCIDITERKRAEEKIQLLLKEVNHRAKNVLSVVQAVAWQTAASDTKEFVQRFSERIGALAASQDLLVESQWQGVEIDALVRSQLAHFKDLIGGRIELLGLPLRLSASSAQTIGMALHELATNAGKYGALSNCAGKVEIAWRIDCGEEAAGRFTLSWTERGGPPVVAPTRRGFGSIVTDAAPRRQFDASVALDYAPTGLTWRLECCAAAVLDTDGISLSDVPA